VLMHHYAKDVETRIEATYADLELARASGSEVISPSPFPLAKVEVITRKILDVNEEWGEMYLECFNALGIYVAEQAAALWGMKDLWIPQEIADANLEKAMAEYRKLTF